MGKVRHVINDGVFWDSAIQNKWTMLRILNQFSEIAVSMFEWDGLPPEIDERFLETILYRQGSVLFFKDEVLDKFVVTRVALGGQVGLYDVPIERNFYASNGYHGKRMPEDSVIIWNNYSHSGSYETMKSYAMDIYDIHRTAIINCNAQKTPVLLICDENQRLTLENAYMKYAGNAPVIKGKKDQLYEDSIKVLNTQAPFVAPQLLAVEKQLFAEAMNYLGIQGSASEKRERMISAEAAANQGQTFAMRHSRLAMRQAAADDINRMFGLNIQVKFRTETLEAFMVDEKIGGMGVSEDGKIYGDN